MLAGQIRPQRGQVICRTEPILIHQDINVNTTTTTLQNLLGTLATTDLAKMKIARELYSLGLQPLPELVNASGFSQGQRRKLHMLAAKLRRPNLLLLDEPTQDLDKNGIHWLYDWLAKWSNGLILVSHDRHLLSHFCHFFIVAESGCRYFPGTFAELEQDLERENTDNQKKYIRNLNVLADREEHNIRVSRRRQRKKNLGRLHEVARMPARIRLNCKRSYAQVYQGKREKVRQDRISAAREWAKATRRALAITLPMQLLMPDLPEDDGQNIITLDGVSQIIDGRRIFESIDLSLRRDRIGVIGPNGAGKTTLIRTMLGDNAPTSGTATTILAKIGSIAQGATDWMADDSLLWRLIQGSSTSSAKELALRLIGHKFPLPLAERPLSSLSPGERVRAALICLFERSPAVECLVLDEPTCNLDLVGNAALRTCLQTWQGGLVVASNDAEFLQFIGVDRYLVLDGLGGHIIIESEPSSLAVNHRY